MLKMIKIVALKKKAKQMRKNLEDLKTGLSENYQHVKTYHRRATTLEISKCWIKSSNWKKILTKIKRNKIMNRLHTISELNLISDGNNLIHFLDLDKAKATKYNNSLKDRDKVPETAPSGMQDQQIKGKEIYQLV
jgi:hypothetical protein